VRFIPRREIVTQVYTATLVAATLRLLHARDRGLESLASLLTEEALDAVEQAVLNRLPAGSRESELVLTTDNGTQFTSSRFVETLNRLSITHRRTAYHHPEGNSCIERFHRSLKEEEVWTSEY
jgi:transposase InsO family protein